ncbi:hypothetical protein EBU71_01215 [bacterium]|nr:hypothetical protein [Candidatus Elulimicrobium humile]
MNYKDLIAKLLAKEDINIVRGSGFTASFDIESRTLTLPTWKDLSPIVEEMLIGHEVGHALYTSGKYTKKIGDDVTLHSYMNVIEDVRIEKGIQKEYPGLKKTFLSAYKELQDKDFFGIKGKDLSKLNLIDRINLYYKAGYNCGVKFTNEELKYVHAVDRCKTLDDVYKLANEIITFAKIQRVKKQKAIELLTAQYGSEEDSDDAKQDALIASLTEDIESGIESDGSSSLEHDPSKNEDDMLPNTQKSLDSKLRDRANVNTNYINIPYTTESLKYNPVISYKDFIKEVNSYVTSTLKDPNNPYNSSQYIRDKLSQGESASKKFLADCKKEVNYLVKEFEMKKAANAYYKTKSHKTGQIDIKKLYAYKIKDELFKSIEVLPKGKQHGMIMLVDWSGSMSACLDDVIKQTVILVLFCHQVNIPFQVLAFTNGTDNTEEHRKFKELKEKKREQLGTTPDWSKFELGWFNLVELFTSKMNKKELYNMVSLLMAKPYQWVPNYNLASTPLNESLYYMIDYLPKFRNSFKAEKMTLITLTDGEGHSIQPFNYTSSTYDTTTCTMKTNKLFLTHNNKKYYMTSHYSDAQGNQTTNLLSLLKDSNPGLVTLSFNLVSNNSLRGISRFMHNVTGVPMTDQESNEMSLEIKKDFKEQGCSVLKNFGSFDEYYIVPLSKMKMETITVEQAIASGKAKTNHQIAKSFTSMLKTNRTSRVLLNKFAAKVA